MSLVIPNTPKKTTIIGYEKTEHYLQFKINRLLQIVDEAECNRFTDFNEHLYQRNAHFFYGITFLLSGIIGIQQLAEGSNDSGMTIHICLGVTLIIIAVINFCLLMQIQLVSISNLAIAENVFKRQRYFREISWYALNVISIILLTSMIAGGSCGENQLNCYHTVENDVNLLPVDIAVVTLLLPVIHILMLRGISFIVDVSLWLFTVVVIVVSIVYLEAYSSAYIVVLIILITLLIMFITQRNHIIEFAANQTLQQALEESMKLLEENIRAADSRHASEMRSMIANVAHDLKTVITID